MAPQGRRKEAGDEQQRQHEGPYSAVEVHTCWWQVARVDRRCSGHICALARTCGRCRDDFTCRRCGHDCRQCSCRILNHHGCRRQRHARGMRRRCRCCCSHCRRENPCHRYRGRTSFNARFYFGARLGARRHRVFRFRLLGGRGRRLVSRRSRRSDHFCCCRGD